MKKLLFIFLFALLPLSASAFATTSATWIATSSSIIQPNRINGVDPSLVVQGNGTSTIYGNLSVGGYFTAAGLTSCIGTGFLHWNGGLFSCGTASGSGGWSTTSSDYYATQFRDFVVNSFGALAPTTTRGIFITASSTIGSGLPNGGLTISGNSTTTASSTVFGQMGVGTSSPRVRLEIGANGAADEGVYVSSNGNSFIDLRADQDNDVAEIGHSYIVFHQDALGTVADIGLVQTSGQSASGLTMTGATTNAYVIASPNSASLLQIGTNTTVKETFDTTGRIGVGTTTPFWLFQLASNTPALAFSDMNAPLDTKHWLVGNYDGAFAIGTSTDLLTSTSTFFIIRPTNSTFGNVFGFGTSSPSTNYKMSVQGGIYAQTSNGTAFFTGQQGGVNYTNSQAIFTAISDNPSGSANFILKGTPGGPGGTLTTSIRFDGAAGFGTTSPFGFHAINPNGVTGPEFVIGSSTKTDLIVTNNGFVGLGTTSPYTTLAIVGTTTTSTLNATSTIFGAGLIACNSASNALTWNAGIFGCNTITGGAGSWATSSNDYYASQFRDWSLQGSPVYLAPTTSQAILVNNATSTITNLTSVNSTSTAATSTNLYTSGQTILAALAGKVGIATTSPAQPLSVSGAGYFTSTGNGTKFQVDNTGGNGSQIPYLFEADNNFSTAFCRGLGAASSGCAKLTVTSSGALAVASDNTISLSPNNAQALIAHTNGNIGIGSMAGNTLVNKFTVAGSVAIGSGYTTTAAPTDGFIVQGNTGIGSTTPGTPLSVTGSGGFTGQVYAPNFLATSSTIVSSFQQVTHLSSTTLQNFTGIQATTTQATTTSLAISSLGTPAGAFLAVNPAGSVIATTSPSGGSSIPVGSIQAYASTTAPAGWLLADGTAVSRMTYAALFALLGTSYGIGDGSTTFNVPNVQNRNIIMASSTSMMAQTGGEQWHTMTISELVSHSHGISTNAGAGNDSGGTVRSNAQSVNQSGGTGATGGSAPFNVRDPYIIMMYIIKT